MTALTIKSVGNSAGVLLPKEILTKLRVDKGDVLHVIETENGIELTPYDPEFDAQMAVAEDIMREDRDILRKLFAAVSKTAINLIKTYKYITKQLSLCHRP